MSASRTSVSSGTDSRLRVEGLGNAARRHRIGTALVAGQFLMIALCLLPLGPALGSGQLRPLGLACLGLAAVVGILALAAMGSDMRVHPVPGSGVQLRTNGIYSIVRHPMYLAVLLACTGVTLSTGRVLSMVALAGLGLVMHVKSRFEDRMLEERFGWQFAVYAQRVPALVPQPWRSRKD